MASRDLEAEIDELFQRPLDEFTAARNTLAKSDGKDASHVRALAKPPLAAWAVNQVYWQDRSAWDALIAAADEARRAHKAVLSGRSGDVRAAGKAHDEAVDTALKSALTFVTAAGHPATDATKQAILNTLRALPADAHPGRLTRTLQPGGFEMLAGLGVAGVRSTKARPQPAPVTSRPETRKPPHDTKARSRARDAAAAAERAVRAAEQALRREEFEVARTTREEKRVAAALEKAREALARAEADVDKAEREHATAVRHREAAQTRAKDAKSSLGDAHARAEAAAAALEALER